MWNRRIALSLFLLFAALALATAASLWSETATLDASNGYCWEKRFKATGPLSLHIALEPADTPVDAFLYGKDDAVVARASGQGALALDAPGAGAYTLALVGGRKTAAKASVTAEAK